MKSVDQFAIDYKEYLMKDASVVHLMILLQAFGLITYQTRPYKILSKNILISKMDIRTFIIRQMDIPHEP